jgi:hypothetical protein
MGLARLVAIVWLHSEAAEEQVERILLEDEDWEMPSKRRWRL